MGKNFSIGRPKEQALLGNKLGLVRDDLGLSLDPMEHADPNCGTCYGRGIYVRVVLRGQVANPDDVAISPDGKYRFTETCVCAKKRYARRRRLMEATAVEFAKRKREQEEVEKEEGEGGILEGER